MKQRKGIAWILFCLSFVMYMAGCGVKESPAQSGSGDNASTYAEPHVEEQTQEKAEEPEADQPETLAGMDTQVKLLEHSLTLRVGQRYELACETSGAAIDLTWSSDDPSVVAVTNGDLVTSAALVANQEGTATVSVSIGVNSDVCQVEVIEAEPLPPEDETADEMEEDAFSWRILDTPIEPDYDGRVGPEQPTKLTDGYWYAYSEQASCVCEYVFHEDGTVTAYERYYYDDSSGYYESEWSGAAYTVNDAKGTVTIGSAEWTIDYQGKKLWIQYLDYWRGLTFTTYMQYYSKIPNKEEMQAGGKAFTEAWNNQDFQKIVDYILPESNSRYLTEADLEPLIHEKLSLARNEILARHGVRFENENVSRWFNNREWYEGTRDWADFAMSELNEYEYANLYFILAYEDAHFGGSFFS